MESTLTARNVEKELSTGQTIKLTALEDKMLKRVYDYLAGHATRQQFLKKIEQKKDEVSAISSEVKQMVTKESSHHSDDHVVKSYRVEQRNLNEIQTDAMFKAKDELQALEEKYKNFESQVHKIGFKDLDVLMKKLGVSMPKKNIEFMIWEIDENGSGLIDFDEFQLTYYRNIMDTTGTEPCTFFHVLEFFTFDEQHKGYIIEDDCMEILFARHGSSRLEKELQFLFGDQLRAAGGNGTLTLSEYLSATLGRTGRRAIASI